MIGGAFSVSRIRTRYVIEAGYQQIVQGVARHPLGAMRYQCQVCKWWVLVESPVCYVCQPKSAKTPRPPTTLTAALLLERLMIKAEQRRLARLARERW